MLSVEPWLVEPVVRGETYHSVHRVSVLSVEPWLVEPINRDINGRALTSFSALSRAWLVELSHQNISDRFSHSFSALSRAVVGGT